MGAIFGKRPSSAKASRPQQPSKVTENDRVVLVSRFRCSFKFSSFQKETRNPFHSQTILNLTSPPSLQSFHNQKLKQQRDKIKQYQKRINLQLERERDVVRKLVQENKKE